MSLGASSEVGRLRTVLLHRPGPELKRLTPRNNDKLLFDGIPWVSRAQDEHDAFAQALRDRDVEVLYLVDLLVETYFRGYRIKPSSRPLAIARTALEGCGVEPVEVPTGGGSDANALRAAGFDALLLANGTAANHTPDESVSAEALARMLDLLGQTRIRLLTNNPEKVRVLEAAGIRVVERVPIALPPNPFNAKYLATKRDRTGHQL